MAAQRLKTAADVAELLQLKERTVRAMARRGELPFIRIGRRLRFDADAVEAWLRALEPPHENEDRRENQSQRPEEIGDGSTTPQTEV